MQSPTEVDENCKWCGQPHDKVPEDLCDLALQEYQQGGRVVDYFLNMMDMTDKRTGLRVVD